MEQRRINDNKVQGQQRVGVAVHSQVRKIKQEYSNKIVDWSPEQPEIRQVLREVTGRQLSRSPLGLSSRGRPISVGD